MKVNFKKIILMVVVIVIIAIILIFVAKNKEKEEVLVEYEPQEEISAQQERQTMISLYFINKNTRKLEPEARLIDVKDLMNDPYSILVNLLIAGPKNDNLESTIPEGTVLLGTEINGDTLQLNFSEEFISNHIGGKDEEEKTIESIVNTLTELSEVNSIKILINTEENREFSDGEVNFNENFIRND